MSKLKSNTPISNLAAKFLSKLPFLKDKYANHERQLADHLKVLKDQQLIDSEVFSMLMGVTTVAKLQVRDIMIPRSQMVVLDRDDSIEELTREIIDSGHSRFPVIGEDKDEVIGIFLAKDLIQVFFSDDREKFNLLDFLRTTAFIPESMKLDKLLTQFRESHSHLAIVVDEFGGVSGLATIEDVLEQIVGDIGDEHDIEDKDHFVDLGKGRYHMKATYRIDELNDFFNESFSDDDYDTVGGLMVHHLGSLPKRGDSLSFGGFKFRAAKVDRRRIHLIELEKSNTDQ